MAGEIVRIEEARRRWFDLVRRAERDGQTTWIRDVETGSVAGVVPLAQEGLPPSGVGPSVAVTEARPKLGELVRQAAAGPSIVLVRREKPVAELAGRSGSHRRRLTGLGDVMEMVVSPPTATLSYGLTRLDEATGGLLPGRLVVMAAAPGAGGSLLAATAVRHTALQAGQPVLYAASGLMRADIAARIVAAHAQVDYRRLRAGTLTRGEQTMANDTASLLTQAPLHIDDGADLTAQAIAETAPHIADLALVVVDRLQHTPDPTVPLSGSALPEAARVLARLARTRQVPVLAAVDTDDPALLAALDADVTLTLTRSNERAHVAVTERDFGFVETITLRAAFAHARFDDADTSDDQPSTPAPAEPTPTSSPSVSLPSTAAVSPRSLAEPTPTSSPSASLPSTAAVSPRPLAESASSSSPSVSLPSTAAVSPRSLAESASSSSSSASLPPTVAVSRPSLAESPVAQAARAGHARHQAARRTKSSDQAAQELRAMITGPVEEELARAQGDAEVAMDTLAKRAIPDVMRLLTKTRAGARYEYTAYPNLPDVLRRPSKKDPDLVWEARPSWRHPAYRRHPDGDLTVTALDVNAAYLSALKCHLPIGKLEHTPTGDYDPKRAGIHLITPPDWHHPELPNPLGDREEPGPLWITTATLRLLLRLAGPQHQLLDPPQIHESWTSSSTENFLDALRQALAAARTDALDTDDYVTLHYIKMMYAKLVSTMGESTDNREITRPDWMHNIRSQAFANLYGRALKAHQAGLTVISVMGTDELHLAGDVWKARWQDKPLFTQGRGLADMKIKTDRDGNPVHYTITQAAR